MPTKLTRQMGSIGHCGSGVGSSTEHAAALILTVSIYVYVRF